MNTMTCNELLTSARQSKPGVRYARNGRGTALAAWQDGRWVMVAARGLDGCWYGMPMELLVNGEPLVDDWTE